MVRRRAAASCGKAERREIANKRALRRAAADFREVTGRQRTEDALLESERSFRALANSIPQLAWMADAAGWIFWYNERWYEYTGTTLEEMRGWGWRQVHHPEHVDRVIDRIRHAFETGEPWEDTSRSAAQPASTAGFSPARCRSETPKGTSSGGSERTQM